MMTETEKSKKSERCLLHRSCFQQKGQVHCTFHYRYSKSYCDHCIKAVTKFMNIKRKVDFFK
jgi:hypothetical protein